MSRARAVAIAWFAVMVALIPSEVLARPDGVGPRRWVESVCEGVAPVADDMLAEARTWPAAPVTHATPDDVVLSVDAADRGFAAIRRFVDAMRSAVTRAGTPAIAGGARAVRRLRASLGELSDRIGSTRAAIAEFRTEFDADPDAALDRLRTVFADAVPTVDFGLPSGVLPVRLRGAFDASPRCGEVVLVVEEFASILGHTVGGNPIE